MLKIPLFILILAFHPVHVTMLSLDYSAEEKVFNCFLKFYYDDFQIDYKIFSDSDIAPDLKRKSKEDIVQLQDYINNRIGISAGKKRLEGAIKEITLDENEVKMTLVYNVAHKSVIYLVKNTILTDIYKDQTNLVILRVDDFEEGVKLTPELNIHQFIINKK